MDRPSRICVEVRHMNIVFSLIISRRYDEIDRINLPNISEDIPPFCRYRLFISLLPFSALHEAASVSDAADLRTVGIFKREDDRSAGVLRRFPAALTGQSETKFTWDMGGLSGRCGHGSRGKNTLRELSAAERDLTAYAALRRRDPVWQDPILCFPD